MASRPSGYVVHLADNRVIANLIAKNLIYVAARDGGGSTALVRANDEPIRAALTADATGLT